jgi:hypothetical protein
MKHKSENLLLNNPLLIDLLPYQQQKRNTMEKISQKDGTFSSFLLTEISFGVEKYTPKHFLYYCNGFSIHKQYFPLLLLFGTLFDMNKIRIGFFLLQ